MDRREAQNILLRCMRAESDEDHSTLAATFLSFSPVDWEFFLREISIHGLAPFFYWGFKDRSTELAIPNDVLDRTREAYFMNAARNMRFYDELKKILNAFRQEDIPTIVLKGAHIAEKISGNIAVRPMSDVDLLARVADIGRVDRTMINLGYKPREHHRIVTPEGHEFQYVLAGSDVLIEIHWKLYATEYRYPIDLEMLWSYAVRQLFDGAEALILSPTDLLIHICLHSTVHLYLNGIRDLYDLKKIIEIHGPEIDWPRLLSQTKDDRIRKGIFLTLLLSQRLLKVVIPDPIMEKLRPSNFEEPLYLSAKDAALSNYDFHLNGDLLGPNLLWLVGKRQAKGKTSYFIKRLFPSREMMSGAFNVPSNARRIYLYYPIYAGRLISRNIKFMIRLLAEKMRISRTPSPSSRMASLRDWLVS